MPAELLAPTIRLRAPSVAAPETNRIEDRATDPPHVRWWLWPHLLGLDAPAVAIVWQGWWACGLGVSLHLAQVAVLGLGVWWIYLCDRLADTRTNGSPAPGTARHAFAERRRRALKPLAVVLAGTLAVLAPCALPLRQFIMGLGLLALAGGYFWLIHQPRRRHWTAILPKEAIVGAIFAAGSAFFPLCQSPGVPHLLLAAVGAFGAVCFLNCALITTWERNLPDCRDPASLLNAFPRLAANLGPLCWIAAIGAAIAALAARSGAYLPVAAGAAGLGLLHGFRQRLSVHALRVLADAVLLGPLAAVVWIALRS